MKNQNNQITELFENQKNILEAVQYLNERLKAIEEKNSDKEVDDIDNILKSKVMIDKILVKNTEDISKMKKMKEDNSVAIKALETKIRVFE